MYLDNISNVSYLALLQFKNWMSSANPDTDNPINPGLRSVIYCTAISKGDEREWDFLWERLQKTNNANEKSTILRSLACTKHIWILKVNCTPTYICSSNINRKFGNIYSLHYPIMFLFWHRGT